MKTCGYCGGRVGEGHFCAKCGLCMKRCTGGCKDIPNVLQGVKWVKGWVNELDRPLGLEIELSNWGGVQNIQTKHFVYEVVRDGSVVPSAQEMVVGPLSGDEFVKGVCDIGRVLFDGGARVNESCGLHVHVGGLDLNEWDIRRVFTVYAGLEREIYGELVDKVRVDRSDQYGCQHFAKKLDARWKMAIERMWMAKGVGDLKSIICRLLYKTSLEDYENVKRYKESKIIDGWHGDLVGIRYTGLNLHSWMHRGTLEFRMKEGTTDLRELLYWPLFCGWVVEAGKRIGDEEARGGGKLGLEGFVKKWMPRVVWKWVEEKVKGNRQREMEGN